MSESVVCFLNSCGWLLIELLRNMHSNTPTQNWQCIHLSRGGVSRESVLGNLLFPGAERTIQTLLAAWTDSNKRERERRTERECVAVRGAYIGDVYRQWSILGLRVAGLIRARAPVSPLASAILRLSVLVSNPTGKTLFSILSLILIFESLNSLRFEVSWETFWFCKRAWKAFFLLCLFTLFLFVSICTHVYLCVFVCMTSCLCVSLHLCLCHRGSTTWPTRPPAPPPPQGVCPESWEQTGRDGS